MMRKRSQKKNGKTQNTAKSKLLLTFSKEKKTKKQLKKEEKERKIKAKQEKENKKAQGIISLFKSKVDDTKRSNSISEELDLSDIKKVKKSPREEAKKKAEHEFKKQKDEKGNLFKQSLNKEKS